MSLFQNLFKSSFANSAVTFWIQCSIYYILGKGSHYSNHSKLQLFYFFWFKWKSSFGTTSEKIKSKKWDFGPFSLDPYPPTIKRDILIRDIFDFVFPPTLHNKIGTFLKKEFSTQQIHFQWLLVAHPWILGPCTRASNIILHFLMLSHSLMS